MRKMFLYDTCSSSKRVFNSIVPGKVSFYTCGPTVYNFAHLGNFRTFLCEDVLKRVLLAIGYEVTHVMNITDIDDKTIRGSIAAGLSLKEFTSYFTKAFMHDMERLCVVPADSYPLATEYIDRMIFMIQNLESKKIAYKAEDGSVYFSISKFKNYGCLSGCIVGGQAADHASVLADEYRKEEAADFALWKSFDESRDGLVFWESPWGKGRPGWHIECSAMSESLLGLNLDIHAGGVDNLFPHHENEIAQSESCFGAPFVNYWMHVAYLFVGGKKMAKREGNFYTVNELLKDGLDSAVLRFFLIQNHYRSQINFNAETLRAASASLHRLRSCFRRLQGCNENSSFENCTKLTKYLEVISDRFWDAMCDDLNISVALSACFDLIRCVNFAIDNNRVCSDLANKCIALFKSFDAVLAVIDSADVLIPDEVMRLLEDRDNARKNENWKLADECRDKIIVLGFSVEDGKFCTKVNKLVR